MASKLCAWIPYIDLNFISFVSNFLVALDSSCSLVLVTLKFRRDVIILIWWSKRGKSGVFLLSLLNGALD